MPKLEPQEIPWLKPRTMREQMLAEMIAGAAIEFQKTLGRRGESDDQDQDYWSGYWAALIDYGRRIFNVPNYSPGNWHEKEREDEDQTRAAAEEDGTRPVSDEEMPGL